jgi:hypothetical protein
MKGRAANLAEVRVQLVELAVVDELAQFAEAG